MAKLVKYFVSGATNSFVEFDLNYSQAGISLRGTEVVYTGGSAVDSVYVAPGISFDFTKASGSTDVFYLNGVRSDYNLSYSGTTLLLTQRTDGEVLKFAAGSALGSDRIIFKDGAVSTKTAYDAAVAGTTPQLDASAKVPEIKADVYSALGTMSTNTIKAFAATNDGSTFATTPKPGISMVVTGGSGVDIVYVAKGSDVDATKLSSGIDEVYLTGRLADYTTSYSGTTLILARTIEGFAESVKVAGGSSLAYDKLIFADGFVKSADLFNFAKTSGSSLPTPDGSIKTPGLSLEISSSSLSGVVNLDVTSNIVLDASESVTGVAGKKIRIINEANSGTKLGLFGESNTNSFEFDAAGAQVTVAGGKITINPDVDFDFSNNYRIEIDAGAFSGLLTGQASAALSSTTAIRFSTVTPDTDKSITSTTGLSKVMQADGKLADSYVWKDIEGWPAGKTGSQASLDLSGAKVALVTADLLSLPSVYDKSTSTYTPNVTTGNFNLRLSNFGADDLIYMDDLGRNNSAENVAATTELIFAFQAVSTRTDTTFNFDPGTFGGVDKDGGNIDVIGQAFATLAEWQQALGSTRTPFVYGSTADASAPVFQSAITSADGTKVLLTYNESLSATTAAATAFAVSVAGQSRGVTGVSVLGSSVTLTLSSAVQTGQVVTVAYTDPTTGNDANAVQDASGNDAVTLAATAVTNAVSDTAAPAFQSATTSTDGTKVVLTYNESLSATTAAATAFAVAVGGVARAVSGVAVSGSTVSLTLSSAVQTGQTVTVAYTDPTTGNDVNAVQDASGNDAVTLGATAVTNAVPDTTSPVFQSAATSSDGAKVVLTYNEALSATTAAATAFNVLVAGQTKAVSSVAVSGSTVSLTLASAVQTGQAVTVAYTDPTAGNDANAVQDVAGNDAVTLAATTVTNNSTVSAGDTTSPVFQSAATSSDGTKVVLTYNEALNATTAATTAFNVTVAGQTSAVSGAAVSGSTVSLTLASAVQAGQAVTVAYTDPTTGNDATAVQDLAGNDAATLVATAVTNSVVSASAPNLALSTIPLLTPDITSLSGTTAANASVSVYLSSNLTTAIASATANGSGAWTIPLSSITALANPGAAVALTLKASLSGQQSTAVSKVFLVSGSSPSTGTADDNLVDLRAATTAANDRYKDSIGDDLYYLGGGDDLLLGIFSSETNFASRGNNTFFGGDGNDRFAGIGDGDYFFGGAGSDAVWIAGASTAYKVYNATAGQNAIAQAFDSSATSGYVIRETSGTGAGFYVSGVETIEFAADGMVAQLNQLATNFTA